MKIMFVKLNLKVVQTLSIMGIVKRMIVTPKMVIFSLSVQ